MSNRLYEQALVVDTTAPLAPFTTIDSGVSPDTLVDIYAKAGVTLAVFTVVDDSPNSIEQTIKLLGVNRRYFSSRDDKYVLADRAEDVQRAKSQGKLAVAFAFQGSNALLGEPPGTADRLDPASHSSAAHRRAQPSQQPQRRMSTTDEEKTL